MRSAQQQERLGNRRNSWGRSTTAECHGIHLLEAEGGKALARLNVKPELLRLTDVGVITALANEAATAATTSELTPRDEFRSEPCPLTLQLSGNYFRVDSQGPLRAEAQVTYRGRTTLIVDVKVRDEPGNLIAVLVVTQLVPLHRSIETPSRQACA